MRVRRWQDALPQAERLRRAQLFVPCSDGPAVRAFREAEPMARFVRGVVQFNSFGAGVSGREQVVFATLARANHSCRPNGLVDGDAGTLRAVRAIARGQEVTVSYLSDADLLMDISSRREVRP